MRIVIIASRITHRKWLRKYGTAIGFLGVVLLFWALKPTTFMTLPNWLNITQQVSILCVVAFTMTAVMVVGDFDLSVGTMASLVGITAASLMKSGQPIPVAISVALLVGVLGGVVNGLLVAYAKLPPFIATLGTLTAFGGLALYISGGNTIYGRAIPQAFGQFGRNGIPLGSIDGRAVNLPNLTILSATVFAAVWFTLEKTVFGRRLYAIGSNAEASRLVGIRVRMLKLLAFAISGLGAAIAGLMLTSRLASANPTQGDGLMLNAIAAVFLGMTMSEQGEPHVLGTLLGVLILGVLANGLTQLQINTYIQQILTGSIIITAVLTGSLSRRRS